MHPVKMKEQQIMKMKETPVLLLTGYLGSGKTTLLNRILKNERGIKFAVIVNDIGSRTTRSWPYRTAASAAR